MNSSESSQPLTYRRQISFVTFTGSNWTECQSRLNEKYNPAYIIFQFWECSSMKSYDTANSLFISCFTSVLISVDIIFHNFLELHSFEKDFHRKFSSFNGFIRLHTFDTLNGQNLLRVTNFSLSTFSKMHSETFFPQNLLTKSCKSIFMYRQWTVTATAFLNKVLTIDSLIFFSEHISRTAILK